MSETPVLSQETIVAAATNTWGKEFTLGEGDKQRVFSVKDLDYFSYVEFVTRAKPLITLAANGMEYKSDGGVLDLQFNPANLDIDAILASCMKDLPKLAWLVCKQTDPAIKPEEVANLAHRPQRLIEIIMLQVMHNNMIQEFGTFFQRLTGLVMAMMPDMAKATQPSETVSESTTEETPSSW